MLRCRALYRFVGLGCADLETPHSVVIEHAAEHLARRIFGTLTEHVQLCRAVAFPSHDKRATQHAGLIEHAPYHVGRLQDECAIPVGQPVGHDVGVTVEQAH